MRKVTGLIAAVMCACGTEALAQSGAQSTSADTGSPTTSSTGASAPAKPSAERGHADAQQGVGAPASAQSADAATSKAAQKPSKIVLVDDNINDEQLKQIRSKGYRPESRGGKVLYCRSETPVGTLFATKTCKTSTRILEDEVAGKDFLTEQQRDHGDVHSK